MSANVVNPDQALGAAISINFVIGTLFGGANTQLAGVSCGNGFTVCSGVDTPWLVTKTVVPNFVSSRNIRIDVGMNAEFQLSSGIILTNNPSIDAIDPFDITSMELLDANGVPIPGVQFVADDGTTFTDAADTATPIPAALPPFPAASAH